MSIRSIYYRTDDLVGLSRVYAASSDAANLSDANRGWVAQPTNSSGKSSLRMPRACPQ